MIDTASQCEVFDNCRNNWDCTWCLKGSIKPYITYDYYQPINRKILSPVQIQAKEDCNTEKGVEEAINEFKVGAAQLSAAVYTRAECDAVDHRFTFAPAGY